MLNNPILQLWMYKEVESYKIRNDPILPNPLKTADEPILLLWMYQVKTIWQNPGKIQNDLIQPLQIYQDKTIQ